MNITIARTNAGGFEAHVTGCADLSKGRKYDAGSLMKLDNVTRVADIVEFIYPAADFCYSTDNEDDYSQYRDDIRVMPCCGHLEK